MRFSALASLAMCGALLVAARAPASPGGSIPAVGDSRRGEAIYQRCLGCHSLRYNRVGPRHCGLIGRRAGSVPGFEYSPAMQKADIIWTPATLDTFLAAPTSVVPGTAMGYVGVKDAAERRDLIAYLVRASKSRDSCGSIGRQSSFRISQSPAHARYVR